MVRNVSGDETQVEAFVDKLFQSGCSVQVGLAIGRLGAGSNRDVIFALIPTPPNDGNEVASFVGQLAEKRNSIEADKRKALKGKTVSNAPSLQIDIDWVAEHARQVSKMLVGGIHVIGIYVFTSEGSFKSSIPTFWQALKAVAIGASVSEEKELNQDRLLLHISSSPRRISCRNCSLKSDFNAASLRPCEWKVGKLISTLHSFTCLYNFEIRVPVLVDNPPVKGMWEILSSAVSAEAVHLTSAQAVVDGSLAVQDKILTAGKSHDVELFLPLGCNDVVKEDGNSGKVVGVVILSGSVLAQSYCLPREPLSRAIEDLKGDIIKSLQSRLEILYDETDQSGGDIGENLETELKPSNPFICWIANIKEYCCKLPRRVFVPWLDGVLACDYLQQSENLQDLSDRCIQLLGMPKLIDPSDVLEPESFVTHLDQRSLMEAVGQQVRNIEISESEGADNHGTSIMGLGAAPTSFVTWALTFIFIAFLVSWILEQKLGKTSAEQFRSF